MFNIILRILSSLKVGGTSGYSVKIPRNPLNKDLSKPNPSSLYLQNRTLSISDFCSPYLNFFITCPPPPPEGCSTCYPMQDKCNNSPQTPLRCVYCNTPCPPTPFGGTCITCPNCCYYSCVPGSPPCCSVSDTFYCEPPCCYGNSGSCYNPCYSNCPCPAPYPPCFSPQFTPPVYPQSDCVELSSIECNTKMDPRSSPAEKFWFSDYPCEYK